MKAPHQDLVIDREGVDHLAVDPDVEVQVWEDVQALVDASGLPDGTGGEIDEMAEVNGILNVLPATVRNMVLTAFMDRIHRPTEHQPNP